MSLGFPQTHIVLLLLVVDSVRLYLRDSASNNSCLLRTKPYALRGSVDSQMDAKRIHGAAGPSGADSEIWQQILCSKQFKKKPDQLCECISGLAKKLSCKTVDPAHLRAYTAGRLIPLDKIPGVRPVGVGEVLRHIVGKAVMMVLKYDISSFLAVLLPYRYVVVSKEELKLQSMQLERYLKIPTQKQYC